MSSDQPQTILPRPSDGAPSSTLASVEQTSATIKSPEHKDNVPTHSSAQNEQSPLAQTESPKKSNPPAGPIRTDTVTALNQAQSPPSPPPMPSDPAVLVQPSAIGPSSEHVLAPAKEEQESGPKLQLTLLLTSGARHPFKVDATYLAKREVEVQGNDPYNLSVYKLKELILREWRDEWEQKPVNPSNIRLISFGRLLDDKAALKDQRFNPEQSNVLHMTIKPQDFGDEDEGRATKTSYSTHREGNEGRSPGCRCMVM